MHDDTIEPASYSMMTLDELLAESAALVGPLSLRLAHFDQNLREIGPSWSDAYDELVERLRAAKSGAGTPKLGEPFPSFLLPDERGRLIELADLLVDGPAVISFNRGHWCEYCQLELRALQEIAAQAASAGASIVSVTPELPVYSKTCKLTNNLSFPMLCDIDLSLTLSLGLAIPVGGMVAQLLTNEGIDLAKLHGGAGWLLPIPATFVVAEDGLIAARFVDPDFRRRMEPAEILAVLPAG